MDSKRLGIAVFSLNQWALDFHGNCERIIDSIKIARDNGAAVRIGPELEICGYSCEDAYYESDTVFHSWETIAMILKHDFHDIIIDVGMPVYKDGALYNCRVVILNGKLLMIRPKTKLANNGNYRENRWFVPWDQSSSGGVHWFSLPSFITEMTQQNVVPFGSDIVIEIVPNRSEKSIVNLFPIRIGFEMCEEMWVADSSNVELFGRKGVHIIVNNSASYWEIRKLDRALKLMETATAKTGGLYAFSNMVGGDGGRLCFYGRSSIVLNGKILHRTTSRRNLFEDIQGLVYFFNPLDVINYRQQYNIKIGSYAGSVDSLVYDCKDSRLTLTSEFVASPTKLTISLRNFKFLSGGNKLMPSLSDPVENFSPEQEIMFYGALWLWDYLRRNKSWCKGFIVPLSGGLDSASVASLVYCMCKILHEHIKDASQDTQALDQLSVILGKKEAKNLRGAKELCNQLLRCCYLKTKFSGRESEKRAANLAHLCGAEFYSIGFTSIYEAIDDLTSKALNRMPDTKVTLRHQNIQARLRMLLTYDLSDCNRLVLATGNVDEALVGYLTKYDCSSADLNPIGSLSKNDLRKFLVYVQQNVFTSKHQEILGDILDAAPSAELTGEHQKDEDDLGLTYDELSLLGRLRRGEFGCCGPYTLFCKLVEHNHNLDSNEREKNPTVLASKVKRFFSLHARNRHKQTVLTPSLHAETYSPDDNRFDHRQFLFDTTWRRQFEAIDRELARMTKAR